MRQRKCPDGFRVSTSSSMPKRTPPTQEIEKKTDHCSQTFVEKYFEIISPKYPSMYDNNLDCFYVIKRNNPEIRVDLLFIDFDLEDGKDCERDFLSIDGMKM
ncbi:Cubilin-like protein [Leptotrombidium deliense]|uniref:Cubilin-like protein n=1 Tax=Leptotrombidium deliense TaxID=299467 RepID=A0A443RV54_9ACAR|nr:Cubilin-like protein [Leptotrombidium deliense]